MCIKHFNFLSLVAITIREFVGVPGSPSFDTVGEGERGQGLWLLVLSERIKSIREFDSSERFQLNKCKKKNSKMSE